MKERKVNNQAREVNYDRWRTNTDKTLNTKLYSRVKSNFQSVMKLFILVKRSTFLQMKNGIGKYPREDVCLCDSWWNRFTSVILQTRFILFFFLLSVC